MQHSWKVSDKYTWEINEWPDIYMWTLVLISIYYNKINAHQIETNKMFCPIKSEASTFFQDYEGTSYGIIKRIFYPITLSLEARDDVLHAPPKKCLSQIELVRRPESAKRKGWTGTKPCPAKRKRAWAMQCPVLWEVDWRKSIGLY